MPKSGYEISSAYVSIEQRGLGDIAQSLTTAASGIGSISSKLEALNTPISGLASKLSGLMGGLSTTSVAFAGLAAAAGTAAVAIGIRATQAASKLADSLAEVSTLVDTSTVNMTEFGNGVIDMSTDVYKSSTQLSNGLYQVISAGVDTADSLAVLRTAAKSATAGLSDTFTSVDLLTNFLNAYNLEASDTQEVSDSLFATIREGKTRFNELAGSLGRVLPIAANLNIPIETLLGSVASLTKVGLSTAESVTAIRSALMGFMSPVESANELLDGQGELLSANAIKSKGFIQALNDITVAIGGDEKALTKLLGRQEAVLAATALVGKQMNNTRQTIESIANSAGETGRAFEKMTNTLSAQMRKFKLEVDKTLTSIGMKLLPVVTDAFKGLNTVIGALTASPIDRIQRSINQLTDETTAQWQETKRLDTTLSDLMGQYQKIQRALDDSSNSAVENEMYQRQLREVMQEIADIVPSAATEISKYGEVLNINVTAVEDFVEAQKKMTFEDTVKNIRNLQGKIQDLEDSLRGLREKVKQKKEFAEFWEAMSPDAEGFKAGPQFKSLIDEMVKAGVVVRGLERRMENMWDEIPSDMQKTIRMYQALNDMSGDTSTAMNKLFEDVIAKGWADTTEQAKDYLEVLTTISSQVPREVYGPTLAEIKPEIGKEFAPPEIPEAEARKIVTEEEGVEEISEGQKKREANWFKEAEVVAGIQNQIQKAQKETALAGMRLSGQEFKAAMQDLNNELAMEKAAVDKTVDNHKKGQQLKAQWDAVYKEKRMQLLKEHHAKIMEIENEEEERAKEKFDAESKASEDAASEITASREERKTAAKKFSEETTDIEERQHIDRLKASGKMFDARIAEIKNFYSDWEAELEDMHKEGILSTEQYKDAVTKLHELAATDIGTEYVKLGQGINDTIDEIEEGMEDWGEESKDVEEEIEGGIKKWKSLAKEIGKGSDFTVEELGEIEQEMSGIGEAMQSAGDIIHGESENIAEDMNNIASSIDPVAGGLFGIWQELAAGFTGLIVGEDEQQEAQEGLNDLREQYLNITEAFPGEEVEGKATRIYSTLQVGKEPDFVDMSWWEDKAQEAGEILEDELVDRTKIRESIEEAFGDIASETTFTPILSDFGANLKNAITSGWTDGWGSVDTEKISESIMRGKVLEGLTESFLEGPAGEEIERIGRLAATPKGFPELAESMDKLDELTQGFLKSIQEIPSLQKMFAAGGEEAEVPEMGQIAAEDMEPSITGGVNVSMITGPTRDIFVKLLSPLKQLNTTFPAMLDVLKDIRMLFGGEPNIQMPDMSEYTIGIKSNFELGEISGAEQLQGLTQQYSELAEQQESITKNISEMLVYQNELKKLLDEQSLKVGGLANSWNEYGGVLQQIKAPDFSNIQKKITNLSSINFTPVKLQMPAIGNSLEKLQGSLLENKPILKTQPFDPVNLQMPAIGNSLERLQGGLMENMPLLKTQTFDPVNLQMPAIGNSLEKLQGSLLENKSILKTQPFDPVKLQMPAIGNSLEKLQGSLLENKPILETQSFNPVNLQMPAIGNRLERLQGSLLENKSILKTQPFDPVKLQMPAIGNRLERLQGSLLENKSILKTQPFDPVKLQMPAIGNSLEKLQGSLLENKPILETQSFNPVKLQMPAIGNFLLRLQGGLMENMPLLKTQTFDPVNLQMPAIGNSLERLQGSLMENMPLLHTQQFDPVKLQIPAIGNSLERLQGGLMENMPLLHTQPFDPVNLQMPDVGNKFDGFTNLIDKQLEKFPINLTPIKLQMPDVSSRIGQMQEQLSNVNLRIPVIPQIDPLTRGPTNVPEGREGIAVNGNIEVNVQEVSDLTPEEIDRQLQEQLVNSRRSIGVN